MSRLPFNGKQHVSSAYGTRTYYNTSKKAMVTDYHTGLDIVGDDSTSVCASYAGTVAVSTRVAGGLTAEWGNYVRVDSPNGTRRYYCHLASRCVKAGDKVDEGTQLGVMGGTGKTDTSYAAHLHYEVRSAAGATLAPFTDLGIANTAPAYYTQSAPHSTAADAVQVTAAVLNVRSAPGVSYGRVGTVRSGEVLTLAERAGDWGYVAGKGWVCLRYTKAVSA